MRSRPRESAGLWDGLNYLLKMCTDIWRLPLPTMTDPFGLRWFAGSEYDATLVSSPAERTRESNPRPARVSAAVMQPR